MFTVAELTAPPLTRPSILCNVAAVAGSTRLEACTQLEPEVDILPICVGRRTSAASSR